MNIFLRGLLPALAQEGVESEVWTRGERDETLELSAGVRIRRIPCGFSRPWTREKAWDCLPAFRRNLPAARFDVVSAHYWMSGLAAQDLGLPWVVMFHTLQDLRGGPDTLGRAAQERELARAAARVVFMSALDWRLSARVLPPLRAAVIPPGVPRCESAPRTDLTFLIAARNEPAKNVPLAIRSVEAVPGARLWVAGQEGESGERVRYLGSVPHHQMSAVYQSVDAVLCPSDYESYGLVTLEAMAHGLPVIVSDRGYWARIGRSLGVPRVSSLEQFPAAVAELAADPELRQKQSRQGRALAERFTWSRAARRWAALLRDVARSAPRAPGAPPPG